MKKQFISIIAILNIIFFVCTVSRADENISVVVNGNKISLMEAPFISGDCTMVPARNLIESLGATISWDNESKMVVVSKGNTYMWIQVNNNHISFNKDGVMRSKNTDTSPCLKNGCMMVPLRTIAEVFDADVSWNQDTKTVSVSSGYVKTEEETAITNINIADFIPPVVIVQGSPYVLSGQIISNVNINRVNIKVTDSKSGTEYINETQFDINKAEYSLSEIDSKIKFGILPAGDKTLNVTAVANDETRKVFSYSFCVNPQKDVVGAEFIGARMLWPVPSSSLVTTIFWCDNLYCHSNGGRINGHSAIDIAANLGENVLAAAQGVVENTGFGSYDNGYTGYGNFIVINHGNGLTTQYSHLSEIYVSIGDKVDAGALIGAIGSTGNSTGNHLDFAVEQNGMRCDPLYCLNLPSDIHCNEDCDKKYLQAAIDNYLKK